MKTTSGLGGSWARISSVGSVRNARRLTTTINFVISASKSTMRLRIMPTQMVRNGSCVRIAPSGFTLSVKFKMGTKT
jgi:hypothetical protein